MTDSIAGLFGGGEGGDAALFIERANREAIAEILRMFEKTEAQVDPFIQAGTRALPGVEAASTVEGFGANLSEIFSSGALQPLIDERTRAAQGQLSAGGLTRSGKGVQDIANISSDLGLQIEQLLSGRQQNLATGGVGSALQLGGLGARAAEAQSPLFQQIGQAQSSGSLMDAATRQRQIGSAVDIVGTVASLFFSDPRLKCNVEEVGQMGPLKIYQWDWIPQTKGTLIEKCGTIGFMADEVQEVFPEFVYEFAGAQIIDYPALIETLEGQKCLH